MAIECSNLDKMCAIPILQQICGLVQNSDYKAR